MDIKKISIGDNFPVSFNAIVEIGAGVSPVKYEINLDVGILSVDRFLSTAMFYPWNYGFIPCTEAKDGDPLDVLILTEFPLIPGCVISCRPIGALRMWDEKGEDFKIISVPDSSVTTMFDKICDCKDLPEIELRKIEHFFKHYKDLEKNKSSEVKGWLHGEEVKEFMQGCIK